MAKKRITEETVFIQQVNERLSVEVGIVLEEGKTGARGSALYTILGVVKFGPLPIVGGMSLDRKEPDSDERLYTIGRARKAAQRLGKALTNMAQEEAGELERLGIATMKRMVMEMAIKMLSNADTPDQGMVH